MIATVDNNARNEVEVLGFAELVERWHAPKTSHEATLRWMKRRCTSWGLKAMAGTCGSRAIFRKADVLRAEERAAGAARSSRAFRID